MRDWRLLLLIGAGVGLALALWKRDAVSAAAQSVAETVSEGVTSAVSGLSDLIAKFEGFEEKPYQDEAGLWTIGFGHLIRPGDGYWSPTNPSGKDSVTREEASAQLDQDTAIARDAVTRLVKVDLTENQFNALVSLVYNIGEVNFKSSTLLRLLNQGDYADAAAQFEVWNKVHDPNTNKLVTSNGLVSRRRQEEEVFNA